MSDKPYNPFEFTPESFADQIKYLARAQTIVFYCESRFRAALAVISKTSDSKEKKILQENILKELAFVLTHIGTAKAMDHTILIPILIRTLSSIWSPFASEQKNWDVSDSIIAYLDSGTSHDDPTRLVAKYHLCWWEGHTKLATVSEYINKTTIDAALEIHMHHPSNISRSATASNTNSNSIPPSLPDRVPTRVSHLPVKLRKSVPSKAIAGSSGNTVSQVLVITDDDDDIDTDSEGGVHQASPSPAPDVVEKDSSPLVNQSRTPSQSSNWQAPMASAPTKPPSQQRSVPSSAPKRVRSLTTRTTNAMPPKAKPSHRRIAPGLHTPDTIMSDDRPTSAAPTVSRTPLSKPSDADRDSDSSDPSLRSLSRALNKISSVTLHSASDDDDD